MKENKYVNKFVRSINKKKDEISRKLAVLVDSSLAEKRLESIEKTGKLCKEDSVINLVCDDLLANYPEIAIENARIKEVIFQIESEHSICLSTFDEYLKMFNFSDEAQVQVLGYYIKKSTEAAEAMYNDTKTKFQARYKTPEELREAFDAYVRPSITLNGEVVSLEECDKQSVTTTEIFESYKCIGTFFAEDGTIVPQEYFSFFESLIDKTFIRLLPEQIVLIENALKNAYEASLVTPKEEEKKPVVTTKSFDSKKDKLERFKASHTLKKYLCDDLPIKVMNSQELLELSQALSVLGYSDEYIAKIQKSVLEKNNLIEQKEIARKYKTAQDTYLSAGEIALLDEIELLLLDQTKLKNLSLNSIIVNYELLKEQLIRLIDAPEEELNDNLDMVMMGIEDLSKALENYKLSDYRFVPSLKTED